MSEHELPPPGPRAQPASRDLRSTLPAEIAILPLLNVVIYPLTVTPLAISQAPAVRLVDDAIANQRMLGMVALAGPARPERLTADDIFRVGTAAVVHRMVRLHDNTLRVAVEGVVRFEVLELLSAEPGVARIRPLTDGPLERAARAEARALERALRALARRLPAQGAQVIEELAAEADPQRLSFLAAARLLTRGSLADRQEALEITSIAERLARLRRVVERDLAALES